MKKRTVSPALKVAFTVTLTLAIALAVALILARFFLTSRYFRVKDVITAKERGVILSHLVGRNIFSIDLRQQARLLTEQYPMYKKVRIVRIMPDRIFVDFLPRVSVAYIRLYKLYSVDDECVLFDVPRDTNVANLPLISGLETKIFGPKAGKKFAVKELQLALSIVKEVQSNRLLRYWKIKRVDVSNPANASFFLAVPVNSNLPEPLEIKIGGDDIRSKVAVLSGLLIQLKNDWLAIKYMDLRFKEPVIKFKDAHAKK